MAMQGVSLFRKWRSQKFSDLLYQDNVVRTLKNVLESGSPARAYLFCGPRGTGKTSAARIFAKSLCCENGPTLEPCGECSLCRSISSGSCLDVFEIDAASNTQVEKIRDFIVDKVHFAPSQARFKIYIIDEVHKLSSASFNALLKTLEEPPPHVVFVLATTHPQELLPTILSRCQRYEFKPFSLAQIRAHLTHVAEQEAFELESDACLLLARAAGGSMRDALVLLEQAHSYCGSKIPTSMVNQMLGWLPSESVHALVTTLAQGSAAGALKQLQELSDSGVDFTGLCDHLTESLRILMLLKVGSPDSSFHELSESQQTILSELATTVQVPQLLNWLRTLMDCRQKIAEGAAPRLACEVAFVGICVPSVAAPGGSSDALLIRIEQLEKRLSSGAPLPAAVPERFKVPTSLSTKPIEPQAPAVTAEPKVFTPPKELFVNPMEMKARAETESPTVEVKPESAPEPKLVEATKPEAKPLFSPPKMAPAKAPAAAAQPKDAKEFWLKFIERLRVRDKRMSAILVDASLSVFEPPVLTISFPGERAWHQEKTLESKALIEEVCQELLGQPVKLTVSRDASQQLPDDEARHQDLVKRATGLFGAKVVES
jgi:DNA polymerase-3 subunit gamma/tau